MPDEQKSYYEKNGILFPRVTHILKVVSKPGLDRWRGRLGNPEADAAAREGSRIGSEFHEIAYEINQGAHQKRGWQAPGEYRFMAAAYIDWIHRYVTQVTQIETALYSKTEPDDPEPAYGGKPDLLAVFRGDSLPSIIDLKTSNSVGLDWPLQLSAYRRLAQINGIETQRRVILRIPKSGKIEPEMYDFPDHEDDQDAWYHTLGLWAWTQHEKDRRKRSFVVAGL